MIDAVVIVCGWPKRGFAGVPWTKRWIERFEARGLEVAVSSGEEPAAELARTIGSLAGRRIGLFACSGHVPTALSALMADLPIARAAVAYGYMLGEGTAEAAKSFGFANPVEGKTIDDVRDDVPILIVRSGRDEMPRLNETIDAFAAGALRRNLPVTVINRPEAEHGIDDVDAIFGFFAAALPRDI